MRLASSVIPAVFAFTLLIPHALFAEIKLPGGGKIEKVDFERHVMGLFGKTGCNNGSCHGSFQGKNGFRLSLFGYEPERDFLALTREIHGRRIDRVDPDASLLLQKSIGTMRHDGGVRFSRDSWQYQIMREWIQQGATWKKGSGEIAQLILEPKEYAFIPEGKSLQVKVIAKFTDGTSEEITPFCDFRVSDDAVANITSTGLITSVRPGDAGLVVLYRGQVQSARILVPAPLKDGATYPTLQAVNYIDREVFAKLKQMNMIPSAEAGDLEFLRRITIDTTGTLPTPEEVRNFISDKSPDKRTQKIEALLKTPLHAALWATKLSDITGNNTDALENPQNFKAARSQMWHDWFRKRIEENMPYDEIVHGVLVATSREGMSGEAWFEQAKQLDENLTKFETTLYANRKTLDLFWRRQQAVPVDQWGQKVAAAFLGVRLECAECHKHPTDRWTQTDYRSFANFFTTVGFPANQFSDPELKKLADAENNKRKEGTTNNNQLNVIREVFLVPARPQTLLIHPDTGKPLTPKTLGGPEIAPKSGMDIREDLFQWMRAPENPYFARSFVNRIWAHYFGIGLVDPVDDFSVANPPTNARLLDALAKDFIDHKFDIRHIERQILLSRTYQTSSVPNQSNKFDRNNFSRAYIRPMMAEVVVDVLNAALGASETFNATDAPAGKKMIEIGSSRFLGNPNLTYVLRIFGRPPRTTACDCERTMDPALPQTLFRMTDPAILGKLRLPTGRLAALAKSKKSEDEILEEMFLATLSRFPTEDEKKAFAEHKKKGGDKATMLVDVMWALINTREFVLNH